MGLFSKKNKEEKQTTFCISPKEILYLIDLAIKAIDDYQIEYEISFSIGNELHMIGIDYDRVNAPKKGYCSNYMTVYLDDQKFKSIEELYNNALLNDSKFCEFGKELILDITYKDALETGNIEDYDSTVFLGSNSVLD